MPYNLKFLPKASDNFENLDRSIQRKIIARLNWLTANVDSFDHLNLRASLKGFYKLRVGDYRVVYELLRDEELILVQFIGHRSRVYKC